MAVSQLAVELLVVGVVEIAGEVGPAGNRRFGEGADIRGGHVAGLARDDRGGQAVGLTRGIEPQPVGALVVDAAVVAHESAVDARRAVSGIRHRNRNDVDRTADGVAAVEHAGSTANHFDAIGKVGFDIGRVAHAELLMIDADAVVENADAIAAQAAHDGLADLGAGADIADTGELVERVAQRAALLAAFFRTADDIHVAGRIEHRYGRGRAGGGDGVELERSVFIRVGLGGFLGILVLCRQGSGEQERPGDQECSDGQESVRAPNETVRGLHD